MIKAQDLRKGNIIYVLYDETEIGGSRYWAWSKYSEDDKIEEYPNCYRPIELTDKLLAHIGFEVAYRDGSEIDLMVYKKRMGEYEVFWYSDGRIYFNSEGQSELMSCQYLHDLQNVVFDKLGTELSITL